MSHQGAARTLPEAEPKLISQGPQPLTFPTLPFITLISLLSPCHFFRSQTTPYSSRTLTPSLFILSQEPAFSTPFPNPTLLSSSKRSPTSPVCLNHLSESAVSVLALDFVFCLSLTFLTSFFTLFPCGSKHLWGRNCFIFLYEMLQS